jgi:glycosyltransferase involved in cell wall biosynthesis
MGYLVDKTILLISPEAWDHISVSKHHYAIHLAKRGNKVYFLNPPSDTLKVEPARVDNLFVVSYKGFPMGLRYYPSIIQRGIVKRTFAGLEYTCSAHFDVAWSFDNSVFYDFSALPKRVLRISHLVDFNQNYQVKKAALTADFCFCTTEALRKRLSVYNEKTFKINHGYNPPLSASAQAPGGNRVKALYAGNLSINSIDWCIIGTVVEEHPEIDFVFVGPDADAPADRNNRCAKERTLRAPNAHFIGRVEADDLHGYYQSADVLLVAYRERYHADQVSNPHKMMEYLGSGKVIVATATLEFLDLYPLIVMSARNCEWSKLFSRVIHELAYFNSQELQSSRRAFAWKNSYEEQINRIEGIIESQ